MFKKPGIVLTRFSLIFAMLSLAACGGGGGGGSSDNGSDPVPDGGSDPVIVESVLKPGVFSSTITYDSGDTEEAFALISPSGEYSIFSSESQTGTFGTLTFRSDDTFSGNGTSVFLNGTWQSIDGSVEGGVVDPEVFTATFAAATAEPEFGLDVTGTRENEVSDLRVTMEDISGTYSMMTGQLTTTVTINPSADGGAVTGSDGTGCSINGTIVIPDPAYNIFEGVLSLTNCPALNGVSPDQRNGDYPVVGFLQTLEAGDKLLAFAGTNGEVRSVFIGDN
ncbi:hypothetical protein [Marinobacter changyiensis]|uniref:hypothetical protein n=1 Tax=Marinobacter changyiensis TaxID=2604091 RepID=UPI001265A414|nr:hypothetical protein [Marinobacter changyiensis]